MTALVSIWFHDPKIIIDTRSFARVDMRKLNGEKHRHAPDFDRFPLIPHGSFLFPKLTRNAPNFNSQLQTNSYMSKSFFTPFVCLGNNFNRIYDQNILFSGESVNGKPERMTLSGGLKVCVTN